MNNLLSYILYLIVALLVISGVDNVEAKPIHFAQSSSGAVSLGNYQAGRVYYQNEIIKHNRTILTPTVFTGASAGSINSLLSVLHLCGAREEVPPNESLYWKVWSAVSFHKLNSGQQASSMSAFSQDIFLEVAEMIRTEWVKGLKEGCTAYLGVPITLKKPDVVQLTPTLSVQRQMISITLKITGQGMGKLPLIENLIDPDAKFPVSRLYLGEKPEDQYNSIRNLLLASSAFPGAFPPQPVKICIDKGTECSLKQSKEFGFIDGGLYENQPIKLAYRIRKILKTKDPYHEPTFFRHIDAHGQGYPEHKNTKEEDGFLNTVGATMGNFVTTSRNLELYSFVEQSPNAKNEISSTVSYFPRASDPWGAFMGFFDLGFREFDFLLGMYETEQELQHLKKIKLSKTELEMKVHDSDISIRGSWRRYACFKEYIEKPESEWESICRHKKMNNLRALLQVSLLRLYAYCQDAPKPKEDWIACNRFKPGAGPEILSKDFKKKTDLPEKDQSSGEFMIETLTRLDYRFDKDEFEKDVPIPMQMRVKLQSILDSLAKRQPKKDKKVVKSIGTIILNSYRYIPPERMFYATFGQVSEIGWNAKILPFTDKYTRTVLNVALEYFGGNDIFENKSDILSMAPIVGFIHYLPQSKGSIQFYTGLGLGYVMAMENVVKKRDCGPVQDACESLILRPMIGISLFDRFQLNLYSRVFRNNNDNKIDYDFNLAAGINLIY